MIVLIRPIPPWDQRRRPWQKDVLSLGLLDGSVDSSRVTVLDLVQDRVVEVLQTG